MEARLKEEARRKDDFLALLGHELRNPLAPIGNAVHLLRKAGRDPELADRACAIVERQVAHMVRLVDDLLDISRITQGKVQLKQEKIDLVETLRAVVADYRPILETSGLALTVSLPSRPVWIAADQARIFQVVSNLFQNAAKFTDPGGRIDLEAAADASGGAVVRVKDSGTGIAPEHLASIFEPFMQEKGTIGRSQGGLGLGLALVKGLVELHGGTVAARSEGHGRGSEFTLQLPAFRTAAEAAPPPAAPEPGAPRPRRILIVEDLVDAALTMQLLLQMLGHSAAVAHDGRGGLDQAERFAPEIILCDIGLPGDLDGYEVARRIRATPALRGVHLVALTGFGTPEDKERALRAGFDAHLTKPVDPAVLGPMIAAIPVSPAASA
jgi:CheY-like chemotaxis protein